MDKTFIDVLFASTTMRVTLDPICSMEIFDFLLSTRFDNLPKPYKILTLVFGGICEIKCMDDVNRIKASKLRNVKVTI
jgi:hypothetical protein